MLHASTYVTFKWHRSEPVLNSMLRGLLLLKSRRPQWRGLTSPPSPDLSLGRGDTIHLAVKPRREASTKAPLSVSLDIAADQKKPWDKNGRKSKKVSFFFLHLQRFPLPRRKEALSVRDRVWRRICGPQESSSPFFLPPRVLLPSSPWEAVEVQFSSGARRK